MKYCYLVDINGKLKLNYWWVDETKTPRIDIIFRRFTRNILFEGTPLQKTN